LTRSPCRNGPHRSSRPCTWHRTLFSPAFRSVMRDGFNIII
jgi:hypothetical protein